MIAPFHVLAKPVGAACNLACGYCFFTPDGVLSPGDHKPMQEDVLEAYIHQTLASHPGPEVVIGWQGGEPTLRGLDFFRRAVRLSTRYAQPGVTVIHALQTNGTLLDDEWATFLAGHHFLVGLSLDGPLSMHDAHRLDGQGRPTAERAIAAAALLDRHHVEWNVLTAVHAANADHPRAVYRFLRDGVGARFIQLIPIVEWEAVAGGSASLGWAGSNLQASSRSVKPEQWGRFLTAVFNEWVREDVGLVTVQPFESAVAAWLGLPPSLCTFAPTCGRALALMPSGDLYSCDHFVDEEHRLGNIRKRSLATLLESGRQRRFGEAKKRLLPSSCEACEFLFACWGECPRNRVSTSLGRGAGENYLCAGYRHFFRAIDEPMRFLTSQLRAGPPAGTLRGPSR